jgi:hypothetical protein
MPTQSALTFACAFATLYTAHHIGDQWVQTHTQACAKGRTDHSGRLACLRHVTTMAVTKIIALTVMNAVIGLHPSALATAAALAIDAVSHYWADRRFTLARLAAAIGKTGYYQLGAPRPGRDDNPTTGTGAYHLDQAWHIAWIWIAALVIAAA